MPYSLSHPLKSCVSHSKWAFSGSGWLPVAEPSRDDQLIASMARTPALARPWLAIWQCLCTCHLGINLSGQLAICLLIYLSIYLCRCTSIYRTLSISIDLSLLEHQKTSRGPLMFIILTSKCASCHSGTHFLHLVIQERCKTVHDKPLMVITIGY